MFFNLMVLFGVRMKIQTVYEEYSRFFVDQKVGASKNFEIFSKNFNFRRFRTGSDISRRIKAKTTLHVDLMSSLHAADPAIKIEQAHVAKRVKVLLLFHCFPTAEWDQN